MCGGRRIDTFNVRTYYVCMERKTVNITLSADPETVRKAREVARRQGKSLNQLVRDYMRTLGERDDCRGAVEDLFDLMDEGKGTLHGARWERDEIHER